MKIAAISDIHVEEHSKGSYTQIFSRISEEANVLLITGDLTHGGLTEQAEVLIEELTACKIPIITVFGNHDHEGGKTDEIKKMLTKSRITVLDGTTEVIQDVGFAGIKGFCGGFGKYMLSSFGEEEIKQFVKVGVEETLRLEKAIATLQTKKKVIALHYSPIIDTVRGEPEQIFPFLGSSRLEEPINRYGVNVVFHGHAHHGTHEGKTQNSIPVFNVAYKIMKNVSPDKPYKIFEI